MAAIPFWYPFPHQFDDQVFDASNAWDQCLLNSVLLPGIAKVKVRKGRKLDVKEPPGSHGATITDRGYKPAEVDIVLIIWTPSQATQLGSLFDGSNPLLTIEPKPTTNYAAPTVLIDHPACSLRGVTAVIIEDIEGPDDSSSVRGAKELKFKCKQFFPPPNVNATNTPKGTITPQPNALTPPDPANTPPAPG